MSARKPLAVGVVRLPHARDLPLPAYQSDEAAGLDLVAAVPGTYKGPASSAWLYYTNEDRVWVDGLVWRGVGVLGGDHAFTRITGTVRFYLPVATSVTLAGRALAEHVDGDMPLPMLVDIGSSFGDFTGLGGAKSVRGVLRNRFLGRSRALGNLELRWRGNPFTVAGQRWRLGAVGFVDAGRVWHPATPSGGDLHWGRGAGARITWGEAFVVALDFAWGTEAGLQTYVGLGHLF